LTRARIFAVLLLLIAVGTLFGLVTEREHNPVPVDSDPTTPVVVAKAAEPTYVGRHVCRECHAENHRLHGQHGHASTFASTDRPEIASKFVGKTFDAGDPLGTFTYEFSDEGLFAELPDKVDVPFPLQYALGSGHNAITLLSLLGDPEQGTVGIEHRATWFPDDDQLGPTPGQKDQVPETLGQLFGQMIQGDVMHRCVYCHTTTGRIVEQEIVDLTPNVNCEKCHGPASEHVRQARITSNPPAFSVGRDDWDTESEVQLCGDCHRLPRHVSQQELRQYPDPLVRFQPVGMLRSKCYLESDGQLKCTTCHNPHTTTKAMSKADHVQNCVDCHLEDSEVHVACPISPKEGCIKCHMPSPKFDHGIRFHDHWIRIHKDQ
jgi:predicted CXXCH cytochrome family protein